MYLGSSLFAFRTDVGRELKDLDETLNSPAVIFPVSLDYRDLDD